MLRPLNKLLSVPSFRFQITKRTLQSSLYLAFLFGVVSVVEASTLLVPLPVHPIVDVFYLPVPEDEVHTAITSIYPDHTTCGAVAAGNPPSDPVYSYSSIVIGFDNTVIYYDHWEDGYEADIYNTTETTTVAWGDGDAANGFHPDFPSDVFSAGDVIILETSVNHDDLGASIIYDGRDKIMSSDTVQVNRMAWLHESSTLLAGALEVYPTSIWGTEYIVPVGEDTIAATDEPFEYTVVSIMAAADNTELYRNGGLVTTLNEGESILLDDANEGDVITASNDIQANLITGDICSNYESRWYSLLHTGIWSYQYYTPVSSSGTDPVSDYDPTWIYLFNPDPDNSITVDWTSDGSAQTAVVVPAGSSAQVIVTAGASEFHTNDESLFYAIALIDADGIDTLVPGSINDGATHDWGYTLSPLTSLTPQVIVGYAPGDDPTYTLSSENSAPIWFTAVHPPSSVGSGDIDVCIDYLGDGGALGTDPFTYDTTMTVGPLTQTRLYTDVDGNDIPDNPADQTGTRLWVCDGSGAMLSAAYGQDPNTASGGSPAMDVGYGIPNAPLQTISKNATLGNDVNGNGLFDIGDTVSYELIVRNKSAVAMPASTLTTYDPLPSHVAYIDGSTEVNDSPIADAGVTNFPLDEGGYVYPSELLPNETYTITFDTMIVERPAGGEVCNTATETNGFYSDGQNTTTGTACFTVQEPSPAVQIVKTAGTAADGEVFTTGAGDVLYTYVVTNTGSTHLSDLVITDDAGTPGDNSDDVTLTSTECSDLAGPLAPSADLTCTTTISVSGDTTNIADVTGNPTLPTGDDIDGLTDPTDDDDAVVQVFEASIQIVKTAADAADGETYVFGGGDVTYTYVVTNTGGTYLSDISIVDDAGTASETDDDVTLTSMDCADLSGPLAPTESLTCTTTLTVSTNTTNIAETTGNPTEADGTDIPSISDPTDDDDAVVEIAAAGVQIVKTAGTAADGEVFYSVAGDVLYTYVVTNIGSTYLSDLTIVDDAGTPSDASDDVTLTDASCAELAGPLAPDASLTCTTTISVTTDTTNIAVVTGNPTLSDGTDIAALTDPTDADDADVVVPISAIEIIKTAGDAADGEVYSSGASDVTYTYVVTNTGNIHLSDITIADDAGSIADTSDDVTLTDADCADLAGPLAPTESVTCTAVLTVDTDTTNIAETTGNPTTEDGTDIPDATDPTDTDDAVVDVPGPGVSIIKTAGDAADGDTYLFAGGDVTYTYVVTNTGDSYLSDLIIVDDAGTPTDTSDDVMLTSTECADLAGPVAPEANVSCTTTLAVTVDTTNIATVEGNPTLEDGTDIPSLDNPSDDDDADVVIAIPGISIVKTAGDAVDGEAFINGSGEVTYSYTVTNTGNTYLADISIVDDAGTASDTSDDVTLTSADCAELAGPIAPDAVVTCSMNLTVTVDTVNVAVSTGTPTFETGDPIPEVDDPTDDDDAEVDVRTPAIEVVKTAGDAADGEIFETVAGTVTYTYVVTNTGDTHLIDLSIVDDAGTASDTSDDVSLTSTECADLAGPLAPDASVTCTLDLDVTSDTTNVAVVDGTPTLDDGTTIPTLDNVSDEDDAEVEMLFDLALEKSLSAGQDVQIVAGSDVSFDITVHNQGAKAAFAIGVIDYLPTGLTYKSSTAANVTTSVAGNAVSVADNGNGTFVIDTIAVDDSVTFSLVATVGATVSTDLTNAAEITTADDDTDPDNGTPVDIDSTFDAEDGNTPGETAPDLVAGDLNSTDPDGNGTPDEDDHDIVAVPIAQPASVGDFVWEDANGNGLQDVGEAGIANVTVNLYDDNSQLVQTTRTDSSGKYLFTDVRAGVYYIGFDTASLPTGYVLSPANAGSDDAIDSDANSATGNTLRFTLTSGEADLSLDLGAFAQGKIGDKVWVDIDGDGVQDDTEAGVENVTVRLVNLNRDVLATTITDGQGRYEFVGLPAGTYLVEFVLPSGYGFTRYHEGLDSALDSDADRATGRTEPIVLRSGESNLTVDAGLATGSVLSAIEEGMSASGAAPTPAPTATPIPVASLASSLVVPEVTKSNDRAIVTVGDIVNYTINVRNPNNETMTNAVALDVLDYRLDFVNAVSPQGTVMYDAGTRTVRAALGDLAPNQTVALVVTVRVNNNAKAPDRIDNVAEVTANNVETVVRSNAVSIQVIPDQIPTTGAFGNTLESFIVYAIVITLLLTNVGTAIYKRRELGAPNRCNFFV